MYELKLHKNMNLEKWSKYTRDRQILMIANELNRLINGIGADLSREALNEGIERIFELCDLTINSQNGNFRKELLRWREAFAEFYLMDSVELNQSLENIKLFYRVLMQENGKTAAIL